MKLLSMRVENFMGIKLAEINPNGETVVVGGRNGQGKSSLLHALMAVIGGKRVYPDEPVRRGAREADITVELSGDEEKQIPPLTISLTIQPNGSPELVVRATEDGYEAPSPQTMLQDVLGRIGFDPVAFSRMKPKEQGEVLKDVLGLDFEAMDEQRKSDFDERTQVNRRVKEQQGSLATMPKRVKGAQKVSVKELTDELRRRQGVNTDNEQERNALKGMEERTQQYDEDVVGIQDQLDLLHKRMDAMQTRRNEHNQATSAQRRKVKKLKDLDTEEVTTQIGEAQSLAKAAFANERRQEAEESLAKFEKQSKDLGDAIRAADDAKVQLLAEAEFPIEGLAFAEDGTVMYKELPMSQISQSERLRVSTAIAAAANPTLRCLVIQDGSLLDEDSRAEMIAIGEERDCQLILEVVGKDEGTIIMREGEAFDAPLQPKDKKKDEAKDAN